MKRLLLFFVAVVLTLGSTYAKSVAFIYTSGYNSGNAAKYGLADGGYTLDQDPVYAALCDNFEVTPFDSPSGSEADYETLRTYDCVVISEAISGNTTLSNNLVKLVGTVPIVSMKAYNYTSGRWSWAAPANPGTKTNGFYINPGFENHPLFTGLIREEDGCINIYDPAKEPSSNRIQGFLTSAIIADSPLAAEADKLMGVAKSGDSEYNCVHEIAEAGDYKYVLVSMSSDNIWAVNENGQKIIVNAVKYVTGEQAINMDEVTMAYLYDSSYSGYCGIDNDPIFNNTKVAEVNSVAIDIKDFTAADTDTLDALENFDVVLISEAMASGHAFIKGVVEKINRVPMINFKSFLYKNTVWNFGAGANPTSAKNDGGIAVIDIPEAFRDDALFADVELEGGKVTMFIEYDPTLIKNNLMQGYTVSTGSLIENDEVLATITNGTTTYNAIHRHGKKNMYILLPISSDAMFVEGDNNLSDDAIQIINNAIDMVYATKSGVTPCATPTVSFEYGDQVTTVTLASATADAKIYYTLDGNDPTESSTLYSEPFNITADGTVVKAIAAKQGFDNSAVATAAVSVKSIAKAPIITLKWEDGYSTITLHKQTAGADVYYNFTGSAKEDESGVYAGPITVYEPVTVTAFAAGGVYLASETVSQDVAIKGVDATNIRRDTIAWFNANKEDWYWETTGGSSKVAYYMQKNAMTIYADTLVGADNDTTFVYNDFRYYAKNAETADSSDWVIKTQGQTLYWESTQPSSTVYSGTSAYMVYRAEDLISKPSDYHITFGAKISGEPYTGSIESTKKYQGPFDIIVFNGNNNGSSASFDVKVEVSADGENWTAVDSLYFPPVQRILVRNVSSYEGNDEVYVRVKHYGGSTKAVIYDIMLLNNGQYSQQYVPAGLTTVAAGAELLHTEYYSLTGLRLAAPVEQGITIVKKLWSNGAVTVEKILFR